MRKDLAHKPKVYQAIQLLATIYQRRAGSGKGSTRKNDVIGPLFETFVLGIMALLSDTINDIQGPQPLTEKQRCIGAICEMIKLARSHISNALPQVCTLSNFVFERSNLITAIDLCLLTIVYRQRRALQSSL